jgi:hypothetical protein
MFNSQLFANANLYADFFQRLAVMSAEHQEYVNFFSVSAVIFAVILLGDPVLFLFQEVGKSFAKVAVFQFKRFVVTFGRTQVGFSTPPIIEPTTDNRDYSADDKKYYVIHGLVWSDLRSLILVVWCVFLSSACYPKGYDWRRFAIAWGTPVLVAMLSVRFSSERRLAYPANLLLSRFGFVIPEFIGVILDLST